jgi:thymidine kinase
LQRQTQLLSLKSIAQALNLHAETLLTENPSHTGWIEVICGSMFSGKTEELIRRINRVLIAKQSVKVFKPLVDNRYHATDIVSHSDLSKGGIAIQSANEIMDNIAPNDVICIDEAQFFGEEIVTVCQELANKRHRVVVAGLDTDSKGRPFGYMPQLMAIAEYVSKLHAICSVCGSMANYTYRKAEHTTDILIGASEVYEARCRNCFNDKART